MQVHNAGTISNMVNAAFDKVTWKEKVLNPDRTYTYIVEKNGRLEEVTKNGMTMVIMCGYTGTNVILMGFNADTLWYEEGGEIRIEGAEIIKLNGENDFIIGGGIYQVIENAYKGNTKVSMENLYVQYY